MRHRVVFLFIAIIFLMVHIGVAQEITFSAGVDRTQVDLHEQIVLTIQVSGNVQNIPQPQLPVLKNFNVYASGRTQNFSFVNGQTSYTASFNYVLIPTSTGQLTVEAAEITLEGKTYRTNPINITVTQGASVPPTNQPQIKPPTPSKTQATAKTGEDLYLEASVDKRKAYVNEQVTLSLKFYQAVNTLRNPDYTPPALTGFWVEDLPPQKQFYDTRNQRKFAVTEIKMALFPTSAGKKTIGPATLKCLVENYKSLLNKDPFDIFDPGLLSQMRQPEEKILKSNPLEVEILPLPESNKPSNFSGTVGKFNLKASLDKKQTEVNQPLTLRVTLSGAGNIKSLNEPGLPQLADFRIYNSGTSEKISKDNYLVQGSKTFEEILLPQTAGKFKLPPIEFSYFDLSSRSYKTTKSNPLEITVLPGADLASNLPSSVNELSGGVKDINYLKTKAPKLSRGETNLYKKPWFIALQLLPLLALGFTWRYRNHLEKLQTDVSYVRNKRAAKLAQKRLEASNRLLAENNGKEFHAEIAKAISGYLGDKLNLPPASLSKEDIQRELILKKFDEQQINQVIEILNSCDFARFAPTSYERMEMESFYQKASQALIALEEKWSR
ncbi:MAG: hypothetical protein RBG1_1C00001G1773 [candidate division Zixibacteria bacterium RBG-1]|nr:MAG: hypothetical protein RBG1_1C00001G1773 [candidate division Zixibacteria bacterium RBG-1]OGC85373.1 MAG: hypothetical protein A2V73_09175 [candidate division Zixibacteria bacterium RBG_19FT_COMBO_42_43]